MARYVEEHWIYAWRVSPSPAEQARDIYMFVREQLRAVRVLSDFPNLSG